MQSVTAELTILLGIFSVEADTLGSQNVELRLLRCGGARDENRVVGIYLK